MANEGEFPKIDGDILYGSEVNAFLQALKNTGDLSLASTTTIDVMNEEVTAFKIVDLFTDSTGDNNTVDTGTTTAIYNTGYDVYLCPLSLSTVVGEPGFETVAGWTYSENDTAGTYSGGQDSGWSSEGAYSYRLRVQAANPNDYGQILQSVDFTNINYMSIDIHLAGGSSSYDAHARVYIDSDLYYDASLPDGTTDVTIFIDCTQYAGNHNLIFKLISVNLYDSDGSFYIDNIKTYCTDAFVQSAATTISGNYTHAFVRPRLLHPLPTGTSVTSQISLDGGSNYSSDTDNGSVIDLTGLSGASLICKTHIKTDTNHYKTPMIKGWSVMLW